MMAGPLGRGWVVTPWIPSVCTLPTQHIIQYLQRNKYIELHIAWVGQHTLRGLNAYHRHLDKKSYPFSLALPR